MRLFIAEKPSLAKAIFEGLGGNPSTEKKNGYFEHGNDVVTWCFGHMLELFDPEDYDPSLASWKLQDLPIKTFFPPKYKIKASSATQTKIILDLINKADNLVQSGDNDEEGQRLVDEIIEFSGVSTPVLRLLISDLNLAPVKKALASMQPNEKFRGMSMSALARSVMDQSFGYNLTRVCTLKGAEKGYQGTLSVGRVQSAVLGLVNSRTLANQNHSVSYYYDVFANLDFNGNSVSAKYQTKEDDQTDDKGRLISKAQAEHIKSNLGDHAVVTLAITKNHNGKPPLPLNLSTLQQICAKKFGYKAKDTLDIMQSLYETHKLLTYPRTDNRYLSDEHFYQAKDIFNAIAVNYPSLAEAVNGVDLNIKHSAFDASKIEAHHAILPTTKCAAGISLTPKEKNVYELVSKSFIALFYPDSVREKTKVHYNINSYVFVSNQTKLITSGWESIGGEVKDTDEEEIETTTFNLSSLKMNDNGSVTGASNQEKEASPPKYFTESSLLAAMTKAAKFIDDPVLRKKLEAKDEGSSDRGSIGTEATRASILEKLAANTGLISIEKEKGYSELVWKTTQQGQDFCHALPDEITRPDISAIWSDMQLKIKDGEISIDSFINETDSYIDGIVNQIKSDGLKITSNAVSCPTCAKGFLVKRNGKNGLFWACNRYPECKATYPDKNGQPLTQKPEEKQKAILSCPSCSARLSIGTKAINCTGGCGFVLWRVVSGKELTETQIESLINKKSTGFITGFISKKGEKFTAKIHLTDDFKTRFEYKPK